jgi:menaquinone-dependent protoporphyrinogen oxidase
MPKKVLIAYGSRFGCTEEVSQETAKILQKEGVEPHLLNLRKTNPKEWPSLKEFDGVLIGSGIKIMKWTKEPQTFLKMHKEELNKKEKILGLFVCCASAATDRAYAKKEYLEKIMETTGVTAHIYDAFGGVLDFSESSEMGFLDKKMLKMASKKMQEETGITIEDNAKNDFRDWDQIQTFAREFAALVKGQKI